MKKHPQIYHVLKTKDGRVIVLYDKREAEELAAKKMRLDNIKEHIKSALIAFCIVSFCMLIAIGGLYIK